MNFEVLNLILFTDGAKRGLLGRFKRTFSLAFRSRERLYAFECNFFQPALSKFKHLMDTKYKFYRGKLWRVFKFLDSRKSHSSVPNFAKTSPSTTTSLDV